MAGQRKTTRLRELLHREQLLIIPGGYSPLLARVAEMVGFEAYFMAGSQTSAFLYGLPDAGIIGLREMVDHARNLAERCDIPIFADADTGFGNAVGVHYTVQEYVRAGVAGLHIEDQEAPKKSGTGAGRRCISVEEAIGKYRAAVEARDALDPDFVICARCDLMGAEGGTFEGAVERCIAYVEQGGADMIWLNTLQSREQIAEACRRIPAPVLPIYGGSPPRPTLGEGAQPRAAAVVFPPPTTSAAPPASRGLLLDVQTRRTAAR